MNWSNRRSTTNAPAPILGTPLMSELRELYTRAYYGRNGEEQLTDDAYPEEAAA